MLVQRDVMAEDMSLADYRALAEFRYQVRRFLRASEQAARRARLEPQQYQILLALKGLPEGCRATIGTLADRLQLEHQSAVGLVDRLERSGLLTRRRGLTDRRLVLVELTPAGEEALQAVSVVQRQELRTYGPQLRRALEALLAGPD